MPAHLLKCKKTKGCFVCGVARSSELFAKTVRPHRLGAAAAEIINAVAEVLRVPFGHSRAASESSARRRRRSGGI